MTPLENRIRDALHSSTDLTVSQRDIEQAEARFWSRQPTSTRRPRARSVTVTVAVAVAVAVALAWWLARPGSVDPGPTDRPAPAPQPTQPTQSTDDRVGFVGPPPSGVPPTGSATSELVAAGPLYNSGTWVYADGRIINVVRHGTSDEFRGYVVRELTPSGVEAMRSFLLHGTPGTAPFAVPHDGGRLVVRDGGRLLWARDFDGCEATPQSGSCPRFTDPEDWLPASAWEDPAFRPFVPHGYQVCLVAKEGTPADLLPAEAADVLPASPAGDGTYCGILANPVAREVADVMARADPDFVAREDTAGLAYEIPERRGGPGLLIFEPVLPHGEVYCTQCG